MTLYEFLRLGLKERGEYLWAHGEFIAHDPTPSAFYALHDFYVEVVLDLEFSAIVSLAPFKEGERYERMVAAMESPLP